MYKLFPEMFVFQWGSQTQFKVMNAWHWGCVEHFLGWSSDHHLARTFIQTLIMSISEKNNPCDDILVLIVNIFSFELVDF